MSAVKFLIFYTVFIAGWFFLLSLGFNENIFSGTQGFQDTTDITDYIEYFFDFSTAIGWINILILTPLIAVLIYIAVALIRGVTP